MHYCCDINGAQSSTFRVLFFTLSERFYTNGVTGTTDKYQVWYTWWPESWILMPIYWQYLWNICITRPKEQVATDHYWSTVNWCGIFIRIWKIGEAGIVMWFVFGHLMRYAQTARVSHPRTQKYSNPMPTICSNIKIWTALKTNIPKYSQIFKIFIVDQLTVLHLFPPTNSRRKVKVVSKIPITKKAFNIRPAMNHSKEGRGEKLKKSFNFEYFNASTTFEFSKCDFYLQTGWFKKNYQLNLPSK